MEQTAYNKATPNLVFEINEIDRVAVGGAGIKEEYVGTLVDTSSTPYIRKENYRVQVKGFESDWVIVPNTVRATIINEGGGGSMKQMYIDLDDYMASTFDEFYRNGNAYYKTQVSAAVQKQIKDAVDAIKAGEAVQVYFKWTTNEGEHTDLYPVTEIKMDVDDTLGGFGAIVHWSSPFDSSTNEPTMYIVSLCVQGDVYSSGCTRITLAQNTPEEDPGTE